MPGKISLQFKFGLSYILVILAVLLLLNTYPLLVSQNLVFRTKQTAMVGSVKIAEAALSGLADLTEDNVAPGYVRRGGDRRLPCVGHGHRRAHPL